MYRITAIQKSTRKGNPAANPPEADWTTSQEITGKAKTFEELTMMIGSLTAAFDDIEISIKEIKEDK